MNRPDLALFLWMSAGATPTPWVLHLASALAQWGPELSAVLMAVVALRHRRERGHLAALLVMGGVASLLSHAIAETIGLPRPFMLGLSPAYIGHGGSAGLPSTHATVMGFVALGFIARPTLRRWAPAMVAAALATGWARVYVGVHFPSDIVAGFALAAVVLGVFLILQWAVRTWVMPAFVRLREPGSHPWEQTP